MERQTVSPPVGSAGPAVVYFAKAPIPGYVKTRLVPPLTPVEAAALYGAFVRQSVVAVPGARTLVYGAPETELAAVSALVPATIEVRAQRGADLFARMTTCLAELFAAGHAPVVLRNTDSPDLPLAHVQQALEQCVPGTVVLGPDFGGGYYLLALPAACPALLAEPPAAASCSLLAARAGSLGLRVVLLPPAADVDTFADLLALWRARQVLTGDSRTAVP